MNRKTLLITGAAVLVVLIAGYFVFFAGKSSNQSATPAIVEQTIPTISADSIGLTLKPGSDSHRVVMTVSKTDDLNSLDYELTYTSKGNIPRGVLGQVSIKSGQQAVSDIYLGTCSNVCHPDSDVTDIKIIVKVTKSDGKVYQAEATTSL